MLLRIKYIKKNILNIVGIMVSVFLFMFGIWQLDLICCPPVWKTGWCHPVGRYADDYFQCFWWRTTIGEAYDILLFLIFISFWLLFISLVTWRTD